MRLYIELFDIASEAYRAVKEGKVATAVEKIGEGFQLLGTILRNRFGYRALPDEIEQEKYAYTGFKKLIRDVDQDSLEAEKRSDQSSSRHEQIQAWNNLRLLVDTSLTFIHQNQTGHEDYEDEVHEEKSSDFDSKNDDWDAIGTVD